MARIEFVVDEKEQDILEKKLDAHALRIRSKVGSSEGVYTDSEGEPVSAIGSEDD